MEAAIQELEPRMIDGVYQTGIFLKEMVVSYTVILVQMDAI